MKVIHDMPMHTIIVAVIVAAMNVCVPMLAHPVDSLYMKFRNSPNEEKVSLANCIFKELAKEHVTDSMYHYDRDTKLAAVEASTHYWVAKYYFDKDQYNESLEAIDEAEILSRKKPRDKRVRSEVLSLMSNAHYRLGNYDEAMDYTLEAYKIDLELDDDELVSSDLKSLAEISLAVWQPRSGIRFIERSIAMEREMKRLDQLASRLGLASELYLMNQDPNKAMAAIDEAYQIDSKAGREVEAAIRLVQKASVLEAQSRLDEALTVLRQALPKLLKADKAYYLAICYNRLASVFEKSGHRDVATSYYKQALEESIKCGSPIIERTAEKGLWQTLRKDNPTVAMIHLERFTTLTDSLVAKITKARTGVITENSIKLEKENESKRKSTQVMKWGGLMLVLLLALLLTAMTFAWRKSRGVMKLQRQTQEMKSHFFTNITNELQTPLTVIMNVGNQLLENGKTNVEEGKRLGQMIVKHGNKMLGLVNRLLEVEVVRSAVVPPLVKRGNIVMFVRMLVDNFRDDAQNKTVLLEFLSSLNSLVVEFSPEYIRRILHTLIAFAIRFTPAGGNVKVSLEPHDNGQLKLCVADTGTGIPPDEMNRLFDPLAQAYDNDENGPSVSAGLTLVKQMVEAMNGSIAVDSTIGQGTKLTIIFPVKETVGSADEDGKDLVQFAESRLRNESKLLPLVFIVENNEDVAFFIASHLRDRYQLRFARDGHEALKNAQDLVPDLIITNMLMPVMDGWELMRQIRSTHALCNIPIIAMTSNLSDQERMACFEAGADNVLVKPFYSNELKLVAEHLISQRSHLREQLAQTGEDTSQDMQAMSMSKEDRVFIRKLVALIQAQMAKDDIDMDRIAAALSLSRKQFSTRVISITGLTPISYVLQVRLNYARRMVSTTTLPMTKIANRCGFQNLSHFSKAFKQQFGVSPQHYRKDLDNLSLAHPKSSS